MSDTDTTQNDATDAKADASNTDTTDSTKQGDPADEPLGEGGKKALQAERDRAKDLEKQLSAATAKLTEIERANETEIERAQREAQEAKAEVEKIPQLVSDHLRDHLAAAYKISDEDRELYLTSNDPAVLLKQVAGLASRTQETTAAGPRPDLSQGGSGSKSHALNSDGLEDALKTKLGIV